MATSRARASCESPDLFGLTVAAEGIEAREEVAYLRHAIIQYGQSFDIARPMRLE